VSTYTDAVYSYLRQRLTPRTDLVEDLVQDVLLVALQKLDTFAGHSSVTAWLILIARHKVEDYYRSQLRAPGPLAELSLESAGPVTQPGFDERLDGARAQEKVRRVLARLPDRTVSCCSGGTGKTQYEGHGGAGGSNREGSRTSARARAQRVQAAVGSRVR